jgi:hypothetical protein
MLRRQSVNENIVMRSAAPLKCLTSLESQSRAKEKCGSNGDMLSQSKTQQAEVEWKEADERNG